MINMKIRVIILSFFVAIISGLFIQQSAQGEVVPYNYAGKKLTITLLGDSYSGYLEEYGYYHMLEYEKNQAKKDDSKKENTNRKSVNVASNDKVIGGNNKKIATMDSDGKGVKLQENSGMNEVKLR